MTVDAAVHAIAEAAATGSLGSVLLFGGEPLLNPETVLAGLGAATRLGVPRVDVITNGFWAETEAAAQTWVARLRAAGLRRMIISADAFHAEFTPVECTPYAAQAARTAGMQITWNICLLHRDGSDLPEDVQTHALLSALHKPSDEVNVNEVLPTGRALESFRALYPRRPGLPTGPCPGPSYGTSLAAPKVFTLDPDGEVSICWGIGIGNALRQPLGEIIRTYDPARHAVAAALLRGGPVELLEMPECAGFAPKPAYVNECELCREVTRYLEGRRQ